MLETVVNVLGVTMMNQKWVLVSKELVFQEGCFVLYK
jgi:hypothetical protein